MNTIQLWSPASDQARWGFFHPSLEQPQTAPQPPIPNPHTDGFILNRLNNGKQDKVVPSFLTSLQQLFNCFIYVKTRTWHQYI